MEQDKRDTDEFGEHFQDAFTENESKARGPVRDKVEQDLHLDPNVDSQDDDRAMAEDRFGMNEPKKPQ